jgi:hypothetical protein
MDPEYSLDAELRIDVRALLAFGQRISDSPQKFGLLRLLILVDDYKNTPLPHRKEKEDILWMKFFTNAPEAVPIDERARSGDILATVCLLVSFLSRLGLLSFSCSLFVLFVLSQRSGGE